MALSPDRFESLSSYLDERYLGDAAPAGPLPDTGRPKRRLSRSLASDISSGYFEGRKEEKKVSDAAFGRASRSLEDVVAHPEETFSRSLFRLIREKGADEVAVYKRAGIDRKHFSKIRSKDDYSPKKPTVLALAIALELNLDETLDLLGRAGYTLSRSSKADLIIEYFIDGEIWDFFEINEALAAFEQPLLSAG